MEAKTPGRARERARRFNRGRIGSIIGVGALWLRRSAYGLELVRPPLPLFSRKVGNNKDLGVDPRDWKAVGLNR